MILLGIRPLRDLVATLPVHRRHYLVLLGHSGNRGKVGASSPARPVASSASL